jgi:hypothetical protein
MMILLRRIMKISIIEGGASRAHWYSYDWKTSVSFLHDKLTALAQFAHIAVVMHPESSPGPFDSKKSLLLKSRSMTLLQARIAESRITEKSTYHTIYLLLLAEVVSRNFPAALVHASLLVDLLQSGQMQEDFHFVFWTFSQDYQRAAMSQSRLSFDIKSWVPQFFQAFWHKAMDRLPNQTATIKVLLGLDTNLADKDMKSIFVNIQQAQLALSAERVMEHSNNEESRYCRAFWTWVLARLHHVYLDAVEALKAIPLLRRDSRSMFLNVQAFFSLAAHCYTRICVNVDAIKRGQVVVYDANTDLLLKLQDILVRYERTAKPEDMLNYSKIQLWVLYVGSHAEQVADLNMGKVGAQRGWYNTRLARHARTMRLGCWSDVQVALEDIHHSDNLRPHGSQWFWKTMDANPALN